MQWVTYLRTCVFGRRTPKAKCLANFGDNLAVHPTPFDDLDAMIHPTIPFSNVWDLKSAQGAHLGPRGEATADRKHRQRFGLEKVSGPRYFTKALVVIPALGASVACVRGQRLQASTTLHIPVPPRPRRTHAHRARRATATEAPDPAPISAIPAAAPATTRVRERDLDRHHHSHAYAHAHLAGLYRDEGVLPSLQVLAYLSKYPHMRQALYKRRNGFHLVSALAVAAAKAAPAVVSPVAPPAPELPEPESESEEEDWTDDEYDPPPGAPTDIQIVR
ncbi:hypothetical protein B0H14DRAFT_3562776 [Mycena olivaceomarginata]|nr:hypothetical protein B0H14DRAFT_3562776 [Mycena olivaceomarginata]